MAKFDFKLHALLRQRELIEQERQRDFAVAMAGKVREQAELKRLDDVVRTALTDLRQNRLTGPLNLSFLAAHRRFMLAMQRQGIVQVQKLEEANKVAEAARLLLAEASKQKKIIEKLRDRQHASWLQVQASKETAALDEISMQMGTVTMKEKWADSGSAASEQAADAFDRIRQETDH